MTINGAVVSNPGANQAFSKEGGGTLILAGANSYMGDTLVRQGTLTVAPTGSLGVNTFGLEVSNNNTTGPGTATCGPPRRTRRPPRAGPAAPPGLGGSSARSCRTRRPTTGR